MARLLHLDSSSQSETSVTRRLGKELIELPKIKLGEEFVSARETNQVVEALVGNDIASTKGIVGEVKYIKSKVEEHDEIVKKIKYGWIVIAFVATVLAFISKSIIEHFLTKNFK